MPTCRTRDEAGAAVVATLLAASLLALIGTLASQQAVISFLVGHRMREGAEAMVAAETGLAVALADLARQPSFERLSRAAGGPFPFGTGAAPLQPLPPSFAVDVFVRERASTVVDVVARSAGRNRARRVVVATLERGDQPYLPAALYLAAESPSLSLGGILEIGGGDLAAIATPTAADAEALQQALLAGGAAVDGLVTAAPWDDLDDVVQRVRELAAPLPEPTAGVWLSQGSFDVSEATGAGIWLIDGDLGVDTALAFEGLLIVLGDIEFTEGSAVTIRGALVQAQPGRSLIGRGHTVIEHDAAVLAALDAAHPTVLGRRARLIGWREEDSA